MNAYVRMMAKILSLGALLTTFAFNAHAVDVRSQDNMTGEVVGTKFKSRHIYIGDHDTPKRYRVALAAKVTLLDGSKGALEDVMLGDGVQVKLDGQTGDIRDLSIIWQH